MDRRDEVVRVEYPTERRDIANLARPLARRIDNPCLQHRPGWSELDEAHDGAGALGGLHEAIDVTTVAWVAEHQCRHDVKTCTSRGDKKVKPQPFHELPALPGAEREEPERRIQGDVVELARFDGQVA